MILRYPADLNTSVSDCVQFTVHDYRTNVTGQLPPATAGASMIKMYMPNSTPSVAQQQNHVKGSFGSGPIGKVIGDMSVSMAQDINTIISNDNVDSATVSQMVEGMKTKMQSHQNKVGPAGRQLASSLMAAGMNNIGGPIGTKVTPGGIQQSINGQTFNPNIELFYESPSLRSFDFNFVMMPKNPTEKIMINEIIMNFKKWSAPLDLGNGMYEVPKVWQVEYQYKGMPHPYMGQFKKAVCTSVSIHHNPSADQHLTYVDGMPITTFMNLQFKEVDVVTRNDHTSSFSTQGY